MARKKRIWYPGATYHVMSRGNRRYNIFKDDMDYEMFIECLKNVKAQYDFKIYSICLMTNHFHMVVSTCDTEIWKIMHKLLLSYAASYNMRYKLTGHLFENRYIGQLIEDETYLLEASRYIHLNPVKHRWYVSHWHTSIAVMRILYQVELMNAKNNQSFMNW